MTAWLAFGTALLGIISTVLIYKLNPKNQAKEQLAIVVSEIDIWEKRRDEALSKNNSDDLTTAVTVLCRLQHNKADILQQLGS